MPAFLVLTMILGAAWAWMALPSAQARVEGTVPLSRPEFFNPWDEPPFAAPDHGWESVLDHYYAGRLSDAADILEGMLDEADPTVDADREAVIRHNLAVVYKDMGRYSEAASHYARLAALQPEDVRVVVDWAMAVLSAGDAQQSLPLFRRAVSLDPHHPWAHFGRGLALWALGNDSEAIDAVNEAIRADRLLAVAVEFLGMIHFDRQQYEDAASLLDRALRLDSSYLPAYYYLAQSYEHVGRLEDAWHYYDRSSRIFSQRPEIQDRVDRFVKDHRELVLAVEERKGRVSESLRHRRVEPIPGRENRPTIRVGLLEGVDHVRFSAGGPFFASSADRLLPAGMWDVRVEDGRAFMVHEGGQKVTFQAESEHLRLHDETMTFIVYGLNAGQGYFWARQEDRQVRGELHLLRRQNGMTVVNELDIESYLLAVVPSEMYAAMGQEALKAQAVAARTYVLRSKGRYQSRGFDVLGSVASTQYKGVDREHPATTRAVLDTMGEVLIYGGRLAEAVYSSNFGGYGASSAEVWGGTGVSYLPATPEWGADEAAPTFPLVPAALESWLKSLPDVYSSRSEIGTRSTFRWIQRVPVTEIEARIQGVASIGSIRHVIVQERGVGGYANRVTLVGSEGTYDIRGDRIRGMLGGLKSNAFKVEKLPAMGDWPESFLFFGAGFGHGVGLSQFGAAGMADTGSHYRDILSHYYPGTEVINQYEGP